MSAQSSAQPELATREWRTPLELGFLGIVWGCSFLFMRVAAPKFAHRGAGGSSPGAGRVGAAAIPVAGTRSLRAASLADVGGDWRPQLCVTVPAVRLGRATRTGGSGCDLQCDDGVVHCADRISVFWRTYRHASRVGLAGGLYRCAGAGHRQIGRFERGPGGVGRRNCHAAVRHRLQPGEAPHGRFATGRIGSIHARLQCVAAGAAGLVAVADHAGAGSGVGLRHCAGGGVHRAGVSDVTG